MAINSQLACLFLKFPSHQQMCVLHDIGLKLMSSLFACDRGTQGKSFLTQINTADSEPQQSPRSQVHILKLKKPKLNVTAHTLGFKQPSCQRNDELIPIQVGEEKKKFYFTDDLLCCLMQRWKSSMEISEHSTWLQNRGATDNLIYDLHTRRANTHTYARARGGARGIIDGDEQWLHTDKTGTHTHTHTSRHM